MNRYILLFLILSSEGFHNSLAIIIFLPVLWIGPFRPAIQRFYRLTALLEGQIETLMIIAAAIGDRLKKGTKVIETNDIFCLWSLPNSYTTNLTFFQKNSIGLRSAEQPFGSRISISV